MSGQPKLDNLLSLSSQSFIMPPPEHYDGAKDFLETYSSFAASVENMEVQAVDNYPIENWKRVEALIKEITDTDMARSEASICEPMSALLTTVSLDLAPNNATRILVFVPSPEKSISSAYDSSDDKPDLVAFFENRHTAEAVAKGEKFPGVVPPIQLIRSAAEIENQGDTSVLLQSLRYLFRVSRYNPSNWIVHGLFADTEKFQLFALGLDKGAQWKEVLWQDNSKIGMLYAYIRIILDNALREVPSSIPKVISDSVFDLENRKVCLYSATIAQTKFTLLPLYYGGGPSRKSFVASGVRTDGPQGNPGTVRVFKYSYYKGAQRGREFEILRKLRGVPGVVQVDQDLSCDSILKDEWSGRERSILALQTVGYPLCSCRSVLEFLEAMYDLLEVLRYLVQEKGVLHRDVSFKNVLIRPEHAPGVKIEHRTQATTEPIPHTYRFISDIFNEKEQKVRVALADFDLATDLNNSSKTELKGATGTPMFMANDILAPRNKTPLILPRELMDTAKRPTQKYSNTTEKEAWDNFYQHLQYLEPIHAVDPKNSFKHGAVHDAESVFSLCFLFFNRLQRVGDGNANDVSEQEVWGKAFNVLASKNLEFPAWSETLGPRIEDGIDSEFQRMISLMNDYLFIPWYNAKFTERRGIYEFHLHDFMQRLMLEEIDRLRKQGDPIWIQERPRKVRTRSATGRDYSSCSRGLDTVFCGSNGDRSTERQDFPLPMQGSDKPLRPITRGSRSSGVFPDSHYLLLRLKNRERLWTSADMIA